MPTLRLILICTLFVFAVAMSGVTPFPAHAEADGPDHYAVTDIAPGATLPLYEKPDEKSLLLVNIPHNARGLQNLGCHGLSYSDWQAMTDSERQTARTRRWCRITHGNHQGWVKGMYLREDSFVPVK